MSEEPVEQLPTLHEIVARAHARLSRNVWDYLAGGAESETTVARNRLALDRLGFRPRVLRDVSAVDARAEFLGHRLRLPVAAAPIGSLESFDPGGGDTLARAVAGFGVPMFLSSVSQPGLEAVGEIREAIKIYQLYVRGDDDWVAEQVRRAVDAGYAAFCVTVDTAWYSRRERDLANRFIKPWRSNVTGTEFQRGFAWDNLKRLRDRCDLPLLVKGIATAADAARAVELGVEAVYVSNHGGRQLDHGRGTMDILPEVVAAVAGRAAVVVDGGFCRGSDIVKARLAGADLVGLGRLPIAGLAAGGAAGVTRVLELLEDEVRTCLGLLGASDWAALEPDMLCAAEPVGVPGVFSAFPLLHLPAPGR